MSREDALIAVLIKGLADLVCLHEPEWVRRGLKKSFTDREMLIARESVMVVAARMRTAINDYTRPATPHPEPTASEPRETERRAKEETHCTCGHVAGWRNPDCQIHGHRTSDKEDGHG